MRWFLVSIGLAILATATLIFLYSEAKAETWACSYYDKVKKGPMPFSFVRNGENFDLPVFRAAFRIIHENSQVIHLHKAAYKEKVPLYSVALFKDSKRFAMAHTVDGRKEPEVRSWVGSCVVH